MKKRLSRLLAIIFVLSMIIATGKGQAVKADTKDVNIKVNTTIDYLLNSNLNPTYGKEWAIIAMARSKYNVPASYYEEYYANVEAKVKEEMAKDRPYNSITDAERIVLAVTAIGKDATNVGGYNLIDFICNREGLGDQGVSSYIYALLALDCGNYKEPDGAKNTRDSIIKEMLKLKCLDGGFSWSTTETSADIDFTAMAIQALAKYKNRAEVNDTINTCLNILKSRQKQSGEYLYEGWGMVSESPCSSAQVVVALTTLGISPTDVASGFVKDNNLIDIISRYYVEGGGFKNNLSDVGVSLFSTDQLLYSLVAYERLQEGKTSLYDMTDVIKRPSSGGNKNPGEESPNKEPLTTQQPSTVAIETTASEAKDVKTGDTEATVGILILMVVSAGIIVYSKKEKMA